MKMNAWVAVFGVLVSSVAMAGAKVPFCKYYEYGPRSPNATLVSWDSLPPNPRGVVPLEITNQSTVKVTTKTASGTDNVLTYLIMFDAVAGSPTRYTVNVKNEKGQTLAYFQGNQIKTPGNPNFPFEIGFSADPDSSYFTAIMCWDEFPVPSSN
jgi:hypothetical protein